MFINTVGQNDLRSADLLATTGDFLRIWELVDDPRYGQSNLINSSARSNHRHMQQLVRKAELVNVSFYLSFSPLYSPVYINRGSSLIFVLH